MAINGLAAIEAAAVVVVVVVARVMAGVGVVFWGVGFRAGGCVLRVQGFGFQVAVVVAIAVTIISGSSSAAKMQAAQSGFPAQTLPKSSKPFSYGLGLQVGSSPNTNIVRHPEQKKKKPTQVETDP